MVVAIFSLSAILWACSSPFWAKASDRYGRKPMMMVGLSGFMVSMTVCGVVVSAGLRHMAAPMAIFGALLLGRALFGLFGAASNPANQAYVADHTPREARTQAMASLAGAFGLGTVFGPFLAPYFVYPVIGIAGPLFTFAAIAAVMLVVVWRFLPESRRPSGAFGEEDADRATARSSPCCPSGAIGASCPSRSSASWSPPARRPSSRPWASWSSTSWASRRWPPRTPSPWPWPSARWRACSRNGV